MELGWLLTLIIFIYLHVFKSLLDTIVVLYLTSDILGLLLVIEK